jgi:uncharacterized protein
MEPVRTCLGCRQRAPRSSLVRFVARDGRVVADPAASLPGRGAWLHPAAECLAAALKRHAFGRALRRQGLDTQGIGSSLEPAGLSETVETTMDN